ncbi:hypothetical protein HK100_004534 [Physocladia obscura]|uniref:Cullin family profile domain-containing protein n=1 Tax=Physocladia obscura TaxID=109957 RepID=A0AAD5TC87_9FUNG|nr:hypothetical protein HK100_004534 [Physocladia obscura]
MSLRPKRIDFDATAGAFLKLVEQLYAESSRALSETEPETTSQTQPKTQTHIQIQTLPTTSAFMDPFQQVYDLCTAYPRPFDARLFDAVAAFLVATAVRAKKRILSQNDIVPTYSREWAAFRTASTYLDIICEYLNKITAKQRPPAHSTPTSSVSTSIGAARRFGAVSKSANSLSTPGTRVFERQKIASLAFLIWKECVLVSIKTNSGNKLMNQIFDYVAQDRNGTPAVESSVVVNAVESFAHTFLLFAVEVNEFAPQQLQYYIQEFEISYLENAKLVYLLMSRIPNGIFPLLETIQSHIISLGKGVVNRLRPGAQKDPREFIQAIIDLHFKYNEICIKYFSNDAAFNASLDKAFRSIVNESYESAAQNFPELLSRFCDGMLKKSTKSISTDAELEEKINRVIILFNYLNEKDVFQKFYSRMLAKRLIYGLSASDDLEMNLIAGLKRVCGFEYTQKLQRMFTDITLSEEYNRLFHASIQRNNVNLGVDFSIFVLTAGSWPLTGSGLEFHLPDELEKSVSKYTEFYMGKHSGRKLSWMYHLSKADVRLTYLDKKYELNMSLHQLGILLLFNKAEKLSVNYIATQVKVSTDDVKRVLKGLLDMEILLVGTGAALVGSSEILLNFKFSNSKRTKLKVNAVAQSESATQESESARTAVDEDRKLFLQATIVRILKSRRTIGHNQLVQEVIDQAKARFLPSVPVIKKGIEQLIEKGYMERSKERKDQYVYVA